MRIDPVYLVEPTRSGWSRRRFLFAGGCLLAGTATGMTLRPAAVLDGDLIRPWLHELCDDRTPLDVLMQHRGTLLLLLRHYPHDDVLRHGVRRLCDAALHEPPLPQRAQLANELLPLLGRDLRVDDRTAAQLRHCARGQ